MPTTYPNVNIAGGGNSNSSTSSLNLAFLNQRYLDVASVDKMLVNLDMNTHNIINVTDPVNTQDAATKQYVDNSLNRQLVKLFPVLTSNTDSGWTASASSEFSSVFNAFNVTTENADWATSGVTTNFWVQIKIPNIMTAVEPYRISVKGRTLFVPEQITSWKFDCSNDGTTYTTLLTQPTTIVNTSTTYYDVNAGGVSYKYFRIFALTRSYVDISIINIKKKQVTGLFPQLWSTNIPVNGWKAYASSEISSSFLAYNATLTNGEWSTNGVTANFYVTITMP